MVILQMLQSPSAAVSAPALIIGMPWMDLPSAELPSMARVCVIVARRLFLPISCDIKESEMKTNNQGVHLFVSAFMVIIFCWELSTAIMIFCSYAFTRCQGLSCIFSDNVIVTVTLCVKLLEVSDSLFLDMETEA